MSPYRQFAEMMMILDILFAERKHVPEIIRKVSSYFIQQSTNMSFTLDTSVCAGCSAAAAAVPLMPVDNIAQLWQGTDWLTGQDSANARGYVVTY